MCISLHQYCECIGNETFDFLEGACGEVFERVIFCFTNFKDS
jgi:hypothetical protein